MAVKYKDFLAQYFRQLHFNKMPDPVRKQYEEYRKAGDKRGHLGDWVDKYKLTYQDADKKWHNSDMPNPTDYNSEFYMLDSEWEKMYQAFQAAFIAMNDDRKSFKDNDKATKFLNDCYGNGRLFTINSLNSSIEPYMDNFCKTLQSPECKDVAYNLIRDCFNDNEDDYEEFVNNISDKNRKYHSDYKTRKQLQDVISKIHNYINGWANLPENVINMLQSANLTEIASELRRPARPTTQQLEAFKKNYDKLNTVLYSNKKIYDVFRNYDNGNISKQLDTAREEVGYDNPESKDFIAESRKDVDGRNVFQHVKDWVNDTYDSALGKYTKLRGNQLYYSEKAKLICEALTKEKVLPTDGIQGILDKSDDVQKKIKSKPNGQKAAEHMAWMTECMGRLKDTLKPEVFNGAIKNGRQLRLLISEMIVDAVRNNKIEEAKTAMEILSVMKYGNTTSKTMDGMNKEFKDFSLFSDSKLTWNNNEGVRFVTGALDKTIKTAGRAIGYGTVLAVNAIRKSGTKFRGNLDRGTENLSNAANEFAAQDGQNKADTIAERDTLNKADKKEIKQQQAKIKSLRINESNLETKQKKRHALQTKVANARDKLDKVRAKNYSVAQPWYDAQQKIDDATNDINNIQSNIDYWKNYITNNKITSVNPEWQQIQDNINALNSQLTLANNTLSREQANQRNLGPDVIKAKDEIETAQTNLDDAEKRFKDANKKIADYEKATKAIKDLESAITERDKKVDDFDKDNHNKYKELMAYWDFLETGRDHPFGRTYSQMPFRKVKKAQKNLNDANKDNALFNAYLKKYQYAA